MTVWHACLDTTNRKGKVPEGALAVAAWVILSSKLSGIEQVVLNRPDLVEGSGAEDKQQVVVVLPRTNIQDIVNQISGGASPCHDDCRVWRLSLSLPPDGATGRSLVTTQLVITELQTPIWSWQELFPGTDTPRLLCMVSSRDSGIDVELLPFTSALPTTRSQRLFEQFCYIAGQLVDASPEAVVSNLDLVSPRDVEDIRRWTRAALVEPELACLHWAIEQHAVDRPDAEAIRAWDASLTYKQLSSAADNLASRLRELGVGPEVFVPVLFEKSAWALVGMLAILKAGGAIVPLNPDHPRGRHQAILKDIDASVLVSSTLHQDLAWGLSDSVVVVDGKTLVDAAESGRPTTIPTFSPSLFNKNPSRNTGVAVGPNNPAFAVFTSGSTGQPKGIAIEHGAICTSIRDHGRVMRFGPQTRTIQFAAYTFDDSFSDIFTTLSFGGCVCVPSDDDRLDDLAGCIVSLEANHACLTVTVASQLQPRDVPGLRTLVVGGESVTARVVQQWAEHVYLINSYGPAEASIFCSANAGMSRVDDPINIGVGVGCALHITEAENPNRLLPVGGIGELLIEGPILARCYIRNDAKTEQSFISNLAWALPVNGQTDGDPARRFYRTGDLARYNEDGTIQVLGRKDTQVKLHGQRIELGEIEHHIRSVVSNARDVAVEVLTPKGASGANVAVATPVLAAFLLLGTGSGSDSGISEPTSVEVLPEWPDGAGDRLQELLPSYMIPTVCIKIQEMPMMVSGKLDRKALRSMVSHLTTRDFAGHHPEWEGNGLPEPKTDREELLQRLWAQTLDIDAELIRLESSFFRLGGDSVAVMRLVANARDAAVKVTVQRVFQCPTLREQALVIELSHQGPGSSRWESVDAFSLVGGLERGQVPSRDHASRHLALDAALKAIQDHDPNLARESISDIYPCSALQGGMMALSARNPGSYVAQMAYKLPPDVEEVRFKLAWDAVAREQTILRSRIFQIADTSNLWQAIVDEPIPWSQAHHTTLESYLKQDKQVPMTLGSRLVRFATVFSSSARWFVWTIHHAMFDDISQRLLLRAVERAYHGLSPNPHLAFNVFIQHVTDTEGAGDPAATSEFWKQELRSPPPPSFPLLPDSDYLPSADQTFRQSADVEFQSGSADVTPSTVLRAAWAILLAQYSESHDVVFGCTVNGRGLALDGVETVAGPTFATVPLRVVVDRDARIADFLRHLQQKYVDMLPYEQAGLQRISRWVPEARSACQMQSLLVVQAADVDDERVGGVGTDSLLGARELVGHSSGFLTNVLTIECRPTTLGRLDMQFHFDSGVLQLVQVERLARQYEHIVRQLNRGGMTRADNRQGQATIASLDLITADDLRVLAHWNSATFCEERIDQLMHHGFYEHLRQQPLSPAVQDDDGCLTYAELEERASRLAQALVAQFGVQTGHFVPLCMTKSVFVVVAVLAILKTGGALAMVDPLLPPERRKHMVSTCKPRFLLCCPSTEDFCREQLLPNPAITVDQASIDALPPCQDNQVFQAAVDPEDRACIVFTSGSTGVPKGTVMTHRAWSTGTQKLGQFGGMAQLKPLRTLQFAGLSFDFCLFEITQTLSLGGCVCVLPEGERTAEGAVRGIGRFGATWAVLVPTFASMLDTRNNPIPTLRTLVFGGEASPPALFSHYPPHVRLIQLYGPSETTPGTFLNEHLDPKVPANVGRPIVGTGWIVDPEDHRRLTPIGGIGELLQGGPMVGSGYLGQAETTAKVFVQPPPWASQFPSIEPGQRMYLTGDLFRYAADGTFIFSGRKDTQTKLRGQRLELGEVEYHMRQLLPQAKAIVADAIAPADQPDKKTLATFIYVEDGEHHATPRTDDKNILLPATALGGINLNTLVSRAAAVLPRYMVPNVFLPIRELPFMPVSRKIDRRVLRAAGSSLDAASLRSYSLQAARQDSKPPRTATEQKLIGLVARALRMEQEDIGTNDSFLLLGGDSIDAMRLTALAKAEGLSLTVANILRTPILFELSQLVDKQQQDSADDRRNAGHTDNNATTITKWQLLKGDETLSPESIRAEALAQCSWLTSADEIEDAYPCTGLQEGIYALSIARPGTYLSQHVFTASPLVGRKDLVAAWERLYATLAILRTTIIQLPSSQLVQVVTRDSLEWAPTDGAGLDAYLASDQSQPFSLGDRLSRLALVPSSPSPSSSSETLSVVWTAHHSLYDGFSLSLLTTALESALKRTWDDAAAQRADFRQYIRYTGETDLTAARVYWESQFGNKDPAPFPPVLEDRRANETAHTMTVPPGQRDVVVKTIPYVHKLLAVTAPSVIRAAWALTLARYTGSADVLFGATVSGRDAAVTDIGDIIGPVFSTVPVVVTVDYARSIREFVEKVHAQAVGMIEFQHLGLQNIGRWGPAGAAAGQVRNLIVIQPASFGDGEANNSLIKHRFADPNRTETHTYPIVVECDISATGVHVHASCEPHELAGGAGELKRVIGVFAALLGGMSRESPETSVSELLRRHQPDLNTLHAWNAHVPPAVEKCIHQNIPFQDRGPQLAVRAWDGDVTYRELDVLSTRLAHHLVSLGVAPDRLVPLCFHKSLWAVVAVVAVMKAGGAPVFLNPDLAPERVASLVEFVVSDLLLTSAQTLPWQKSPTTSKVVVKNILRIDAGYIQRLAHGDDDLPPSTLPDIRPHNLGFGVFTSGTTGVPKCILLEHRSLMTAACLYRDNDEFRPGARVLQFASYAFDVSVKDILGTLLYGCELYVPSEDDRVNNLAQYMRTHGITQAMVTPTIASLLGPSDVPTLQVLALIGEKLTAGNVATWAQAVHLINSYGPAEATVQSVCNSGLAAHTDPRNIGRALGCNVWLVDPSDHNILVPIGAGGEIVIEGPIVSRGYLKNADKTAAAFIPPPDWLPGARRNGTNPRLYKTGDLARLGSDGNLVILGRDDAQVKLHGQRIELEEVEFRLQRQLPRTVGVVVEMVSPKGSDHVSQLVAFLHDRTIPFHHEDPDLEFIDPRCSDILRDLDIGHICRAVAEALPPYMLPGVFLAIPRIPLLPSAKTNRKLLRALYANTEPATLATLSFASLARDSVTRQLAKEQPSLVPATPISRKLERLRAVVAKVLRLDEAVVALDRNFQELGGDSITAIRLVSSARGQGIGLTVMDILRATTIAHLDGVVTDLDDPPSASVSGQRSALAPFCLVKDVVGDLHQLVDEVAAQCRVSSDLVEDVYPCTPLQEALMALSIHQAGDYVARRCFRLPKNVEYPRLLATLNAVAQRVPILRSRIVQTESGLFQVVIRGQIAVTEGLEDPNGNDPGASDARSNSRMGLGEILNRFSVDRQQRVLSWVSHHATYDEVSATMFLRLVNRMYHNRPLEGLFSPADYRLFIQHITQLSLESSQQFWSKQLIGASVGAFPPQVSGQSRNSTSTHQIKATGRFRTTAVSAKPPTQAAIRAAWAMVLAAHTASDDVVFGTILSGRNVPVAGVDRMVGPTITTVPIRVRINGGETARALVARLSAEATDMIPHEHFGLQRIRRISDEARHACDFRNLLVIHPPTDKDEQDDEEERERDPAVLRPGDAHEETLPMNTYPLVVELHLPSTASGAGNGHEYALDVSFDPSIIDEVQTARVLQQFQHVLKQLLSSQEPLHTHDVPLAKVKDIEVISAADREELWRWNAHVPETVKDSLHGLIHERSQAAPDAEAVVAWDGRLTYAELDQASTALAYEILARDDSAGSFVAICFEKSVWVPVAVLAVLKAGKAFAFLDPAYPVERLRQMTSLLDPVLAISSPQCLETCRGLVSNTIVLGPSFQASAAAATPPAVTVRPSDPICAVFSSGTTGVPKGAILSHRSYVTSNLRHARITSLDATSRVLQFGSCSFDANVFEVLTPLMMGGCVCIPDEANRNGNIDVEIRRMRVNWAFFTPAFAALLEPERVRTLKTVVLGGEPVSVELVKTWSRRVSLHIAYGPSECSIFSTLTEPIDGSASPLNLGRACSGALWIVDPTNVDRLVPIGAPGELLLEGPNIGEGYIKNETQTKAAFLQRAPTWFTRDGRHKFYRTGDIVKYDTDGSIVWVGRKDSQVKIRGQRVELSDIENHLASVPSLGHAVVIIPTAGPLSKRLVTVFSSGDQNTAFQQKQQPQQQQQQQPHRGLRAAAPEADLTLLERNDLRETAQRLIGTARERLSAVLPSHMIPNFWIPVAAIPVLPSGKLNRKHILAWLEGLDDQAWAQLASFAADADNTLQADGSDEVLTDKERSLRLLWHQVLNVGIEAIHSRSAFLQLGGDSISAMQLVSRAGAVGLRLTLQDVTKSHNLREMATAATSRNLAGAPDAPGVAWPHTVNHADSAVEDVLFELSPIQRLYFHITPAGNNTFEQSMMLKLTTKVSFSTLSNALRTLVKHHAQLRARYTQDSGSWKQYISKFDPTYQILRVHNIDESASIPRIVSESVLRLDFQKGPIFAAELIETPNDQYVFLIAHHLSIDLVSWRVILQDLEQLVLGRADALPNSSMSFQTWVTQQAEYSEQLEPSVFLPRQRLEVFDAPEYWALAPGVSDTPLDVSRHGFVLDQHTSSSLLRHSNRGFATKPVDIFLAAVATSFARVFHDRAPPTVFLEGHGREPWSASIEILRTVGWFTTLFPVSLDRDQTRDIVTAVRSAKDQRNRFLDNGFATFTCSQSLGPPSHEGRGFATAAPGRPVAEIMLNFAGHFAELEKEDGLFQPAGIDLSAQDQTSSQDRFALFGIEVGVQRGELRFDVSYQGQSPKGELIMRWIDGCKVCLQEVASVLPNIPRTYTAGDFPLLELSSDEELDSLFNNTLPSLSIDIRTVDDMFKCTPTQLDMLHTEERAIGHHMTRLDFEVTGTMSGGSIDPIRLGEAFAMLAARHPILRTAFVPAKSSRFVQVVLRRHTPDIMHVKVNANEDFSGAMPPTDAVYQKLLRGEPPYRLIFHHLFARDKVFLSWELSHALLDGNSVAILLRDWNLAYMGRLPDGFAPSFQSLVRYTTYRASEPALAYWTQQLTGIQPSLLPLDAPFASGTHHSTAPRQQRFIPLRLPTLNALQRFCQDTVVTVPNLVHAAWAVALRRALPHSSDVVFGYLVSGRDVPLVDGIGDAAGPYFNTVLSRYNLSTRTTPTLGDVLRTVQATMTARLPFQNFSWPEVRERLAGVLDSPLPAGPLYNTIINIHRFAAPDGGSEEHWLRFNAQQGYDPLAHDMELTGKIDTEEIRLALMYWSTSFTDEFASALAASVEDIVQGMLSTLDLTLEGSA